jgi:hypothetical protein
MKQKTQGVKTLIEIPPYYIDTLVFSFSIDSACLGAKRVISKQSRA